MTEHNEPKILEEPLVCTECGTIHIIYHDHKTCLRKKMLPLRIWIAFQNWCKYSLQAANRSSSVLKTLLDLFEDFDGTIPLSLRVVKKPALQLHLPGLGVNLSRISIPSEISPVDFHRLPATLQYDIVNNINDPKTLINVPTTEAAPNNHNLSFSL